MMTLQDLLGRFNCEADINVVDPDKPNAVVYLPGEGAIIPRSVRTREVLCFGVEAVNLDNETFVPLLVVYLKGGEA